ncbi:MAG: glutaredoxin domain-containing protein [Candidatus Omnitrophica bacterium]|nr:glutaredoxin domain-containing protein [Candidatus Omnitrophota bacterium]
MDKKVTIYSTPTCPFCIRTKQFLKENNIAFEDIDVSSNEQAASVMIEKSGQMGVPVLDIDGQIIVGFDKEKIKSVLGL